MIYLDNAATTRKKPESVFEAYNYYIREVAVSPGRGSYSLGIDSSRMLFQARRNVGRYFGLEKSTNVIFTKNSTEAINLFFRGFLSKGDHVVITCYEHNAILRPIHQMYKEGLIEYSIISREDLIKDPTYIYQKYFRKDTKLFASTLASNLTGRIVIDYDLIKFLKKKNITVFVDASQGAGFLNINMKESEIDYLAFTGHKDLLALPGVGGLCCVNYMNIKPLIQGGTGIYGDLYENPDVFPEGYEAGTLNMPAIWSLNESINYLLDNKKSICLKESELTDYLVESLGKIPNIIVYDKNEKRVPTVGVNILGKNSDQIVRELDNRGICVRGGIHCAILAHEAIGTASIGVVRISLGYSTEKKEIDEIVNALKELSI